MHPYCLKIISPKSSKTKLTSLLYPSLIKPTVCQQWQIFIQASEGTRHGRVSKETDTMATWMSLASLSGAHLWMLSVGQRNGPRTTFTNEPQWVCDTVIFKLDSISPCPPLLGFGPHMTFISICRNCETFSTMDCDRIHKLSFTVALGGGGGRGSAYHLLIMTVPGTSIIGCLSAIANSPMRTMVSTL